MVGLLIKSYGTWLVPLSYNDSGQIVLTRASVTKQYNLLLVKLMMLCSCEGYCGGK